MRRFIPGLLVGVIFGAGLTLSGMVDPLAFLVPWISGALGIQRCLCAGRGAPAFRSSLLVVRRMGAPADAEEFCIPQTGSRSRG